MRALGNRCGWEEHMQKKTIMPIVFTLLAFILICAYFGVSLYELRAHPRSPQEFISDCWGYEDVHIVALTELTDNWDQVFYTSSDNGLGHVVLLRDSNGHYIGVVGVGSGQLEPDGHMHGTLMTKAPGCTLYYGMSTSPEWHLDVDYEGPIHRLSVNELFIEYFLYPKTMDEELLRQKSAPTME